MIRDRQWRRHIKEMSQRRNYTVYRRFYNYYDINGVRREHPHWFECIGDKSFHGSPHSRYNVKYSPNTLGKYRDYKKKNGGFSTGLREKDKIMYKNIIEDILYEMGR